MLPKLLPNGPGTDLVTNATTLPQIRRSRSRTKSRNGRRRRGAQQSGEIEKSAREGARSTRHTAISRHSQKTKNSIEKQAQNQQAAKKGQLPFQSKSALQ